MRNLTLSLALSFALLLVCAQANAALIGLTQTLPDFVSTFETVTYTASNHRLTVSGFDSKLNVDGNLQSVTGTNKVFTLEANLTSTGGFVNGFLVADGNVPTVGANTGVLLTATLTQFGFGNANNQLMDFRFTATGGALGGVYGSTGGVNLQIVSGFPGTFTADWSNTGIGITDTFVTPEPATMTILLAGSAAGFLRRRSRRRI